MARQTRNGTQRDVFSRASRSHQSPHTIRAAKRQANRQDRAASRGAKPATTDLPHPRKGNPT
ncbi:hypothetical protein M0655_23520 (plasmid) [Gordonia amicalis]|jgi:hypothetical protein|uniref:Uncharacterized protein n=1 Tax=Gordonia terrae TaxID=2055 RepID=A0A2I1R2G7_9ACTN|nr:MULTISPECIES: hypothetical protein [Gordonia]MDH3026229.1 hypothetical protein [Gordonia alkanivorans]PKZ63291.1 hypothetical protein CYJ73_22440 [Gordonia terrae]UOG23654.1 hypothetical protein MTX80_22800 [Gordonia amicalis]UPW07020.1 hypothetical protein M1C59_12970 [Gordonia terrae]UPW16392.1 hypothetical protein M0655_23520 [Gordonia amicalis]